MATIACQGCDIKLDGIDIGTGATTGIFSQYLLMARGNGVFSGLVNVPIASVVVAYAQAQDGLCRQLTGRVYNTGTNPNSGWTANALTGCTGTRECTSRLTFYVSPAGYLFNQFPGSTFGFSVINYSQGQWSGITVGTGSVLPPPYLGFPVTLGTVTQECGTMSWYSVEGRWTAPLGLSGFLTSVTGHRVECTYCSPYEMVAL
jgi:hypothetical protein